MKAVTVLPSREEIFDRLVEADPGRAAERLYPALLALAGRRLSGTGVSVSVFTAIGEQMAAGVGLSDVLALQAMAPQLIEAIIDDDQVLADALALLQNALDRDTGRTT